MERYTHIVLLFFGTVTNAVALQLRSPSNNWLQSAQKCVRCERLRNEEQRPRLPGKHLYVGCAFRCYEAQLNRATQALDFLEAIPIRSCPACSSRRGQVRSRRTQRLPVLRPLSQLPWNLDESPPGATPCVRSSASPCCHPQSICSILTLPDSNILDQADRETAGFRRKPALSDDRPSADPNGVIATLNYRGGCIESSSPA